MTGSQGPAFSRRALIGTGLGVGAAVLTAGGSGVAHASAPASPERRAHAFLAAAMDAYPQHGPLRLAQSYTDQAGLFSTAFTYDNALAVLAALASGGADGLNRAVALGDALLYAQNHDPVYDDGRLRQAYNVGPYTFYDGSPQPDGFVRADGTANVGTQFGFTGTAVGDMAWAGIALAALARRTGRTRFLDGCVRIGEWIERVGRTDQPLGGYRFGVNGADERLPFSSTEHNTDLVCLFGRLARLTGDRVWRERRARAAAFVESMWEPSGGFFYTGTNDGVTVNTSPVPEDTQTWTHLALPSRAHSRSLDWARTELAVLDTADRRNSTVPAGQSYAGVTFSSASLLAKEDAPIADGQPRPDRDGVWFEGTAHLALALRERHAPGDEARARRLLASVERAQDKLGRDQTLGGRPVAAGSGVVSASSPLDTGFGFGYYPYRHTGATAWYLLAAARVNPLRA
ncbi:Tat pathway signal sequence domain protein [Streptomyces sp. NPDC006622]|uniref:Tat pathway signal sequence domain protein n=1 Tax=Streptomyces sp. NPDC006622 TaxID=3155459 RepID=UPI0033BCBD14